jgi:hypothetical protein
MDNDENSIEEQSFKSNDDYESLSESIDEPLDIPEEIEDFGLDEENLDN